MGNLVVGKKYRVRILDAEAMGLYVSLKKGDVVEVKFAYTDDNDCLFFLFARHLSYTLWTPHVRLITPPANLVPKEE